MLATFFPPPFLSFHFVLQSRPFFLAVSAFYSVFIIFLRLWQLFFVLYVAATFFRFPSYSIFLLHGVASGRASLLVTFSSVLFYSIVVKNAQVPFFFCLFTPIQLVKIVFFSFIHSVQDINNKEKVRAFFVRCLQIVNKQS